ncbi:MAG: hypothetical protein HC767_15460, partial [Akkermansiaceae bacterium]|nr:hypothetical protein [Akkermansiaceae bacterium]
LSLVSPKTRTCLVDITEITEEDVPQQDLPSASADQKKSASTGFQLIQDAEAAMAKVATTLSKGVWRRFRGRPVFIPTVH